MNAYRTEISSQALGAVSLVLGLLGAALFWLTPLPMGFMLSATGFILGGIGWGMNPSRGAVRTLLIVATLVSFAALIFNLVVFRW